MARESRKKNKRWSGLVSIRVTAQTFHHLSGMAAAEGFKYPGQVVDKMVRNDRIRMAEFRRACGRKDG